MNVPLTNPTGNGAERRQHERRTLRVAAQLKLTDASATGARPMDVRTLDISLGGMGVVTPVNLRSGVTLTISFTLPARSKGITPIQARVQVMHSILGRDEGGFKIGLRFLAADNATNAAIREYLGV
jgi:c-di-GMP-binding flagellar brake protein YcgR